MNKCFKCGTEFEGNFCPECGTKWQEKKNCPKCGKELANEIKFCPECGYSFVDEHETAATATAKVTAGFATTNVQKLYSLMRILPAILIAVFSLLSLLFFIADMGVTSGMGMSEGTGSVYQVMGSGPEELKPIATTMLIFDIIALVFSAFALFFTLRPIKSVTAVKIGEKSLSIDFIVSCFAVVLCFAMFIIACIACGNVTALGNSAGDYGSLFGISASPSAGVILVLVFAILFALAIAACPILRYMFAKKYPELQEEEAAALKVKTEKRGATNAIATIDAPMDENRQMQTLKNVKILVRHLKTLKFAFFVLISLVFPPAILLVFVAPFVGLGAKYDKWTPDMIETQRATLKKYSIVYGIFAVIMVIFLIVFESLLFPKLILFMCLPPVFNWVYGLLGGFIWAFALTFIFAFALCLVTFPTLKNLEMVFYGTLKPSVVLLSPRYDVKQFYVTEAKIAHHEIVCKKPGKDILRIAHITLFIILAFIVAFVHIITGRDFIFNSTKYVEKVHLGKCDDGIFYELYQALGNYDDHSGSSSSDLAHFTYYSEDIRSTVYRIEELNRQLEYASSYMEEQKIFSELEKLNKKFSKVNYKYIQVNYTYSNNTDEITDVILVATMPKITEGNYAIPIEYKVSKVELYPVATTTGFISRKYEAKVWFTDGSYHDSYVNPKITQNSSGARYNVAWTDSFFNTKIEYSTNSL